MSSSESIQWGCCGETFKVLIWRSVNRQLSPGKLEEFADGRLNNIICPKCGSSIQSPWTVLFHDMEKKLMIAAGNKTLNELDGDTDDLEDFDETLGSMSEMSYAVVEVDDAILAAQALIALDTSEVPDEIRVAHPSLTESDVNAEAFRVIYRTITEHRRNVITKPKVLVVSVISKMTPSNIDDEKLLALVKESSSISLQLSENNDYRKAYESDVAASEQMIADELNRHTSHLSRITVLRTVQTDRLHEVLHSAKDLASRLGVLREQIRDLLGRDVCPECGSTEVVSISYGLVTREPDTDIPDTPFVRGGCSVNFDETVCCGDCGRRFMGNVEKWLRNRNDSV